MRGFVTLAVGAEKYYKLAVNLLKSYRLHTSNPMPFAIIADRKNDYTDQFDAVVILENTTCSYLDKIEILNIAPYEENIFLDADCLAYADLNLFWSDFPAGGVRPVTAKPCRLMQRMAGFCRKMSANIETGFTLFLRCMAE